MRPAASRLLTPLAILCLTGLVACAGDDGGEVENGDAAAGAADTGTARAGTDAAAGATPDSAEYWASRLMSSLGGRDEWRQTRFLRFRWIVTQGGQEAANRLHAWDRHTGRYRLEYDRKDGTHVLALFNVDLVEGDSLASAGHVWVGDRRLEGAERDSALRDAYAAFINDSYWLLHPFKYFDPGVHLAYEGRTELEDGRRYPTVHLTFEPDLGVTNDEYWGYIDPETGRLHAWRYHLQGQEEPGPVIRWEGWTPVGDVTMAPRRVWPDGSVNIHFEQLAAADTVPGNAFSARGASAPGAPGASD